MAELERADLEVWQAIHQERVRQVDGLELIG